MEAIVEPRAVALPNKIDVGDTTSNTTSTGTAAPYQHHDKISHSSSGERASIRSVIRSVRYLFVCLFVWRLLGDENVCPHRR